MRLVIIMNQPDVQFFIISTFVYNNRSEKCKSKRKFPAMPIKIALEPIPNRLERSQLVRVVPIKPFALPVRYRRTLPSKSSKRSWLVLNTR